MAQCCPNKDFFRQMPNALLARYFTTKGLFSELDFVAMKEAKPDELFAACFALPDKQPNAMDAELLEGNWIGVGEGFKGKVSWFRGLIRSS